MSEKELKLEAIMERLDFIVKQLENEGLEIEKGLEFYEEGISLAKSGELILKKVEKRVEELASGESIEEE